MDRRLREYLEGALGVSVSAFPTAGVAVRESGAYKHEPGRMLEVIRLGGGVLAAGTATALERVGPVLNALLPAELFSPLGVAELQRALELPDDKAPEHGFDYVLTEPSGLRAVSIAWDTMPLHKADIPRGEYELRMSERRPSERADFVWGFDCLVGGRRAGRCAIIWNTPEVAALGVGVDERFRGRGCGLAVVHAAAEYVLAEGGAALYGADADNVASLRLARSLGFWLFSEQIIA